MFKNFEVFFYEEVKNGIYVTLATAKIQMIVTWTVYDRFQPFLARNVQNVNGNIFRVTTKVMYRRKTRRRSKTSRLF